MGYPTSPGPDRLSAVLCGSFRRSPELLALTFAALNREFDVLSPSSIAWIDPSAEFVRLHDERDRDVNEIEQRHLSAIQNADFVWLFCPDGYVGSSAAMEVGYAHALGVPVLAELKPSDQTIAEMVTVVDGGPSIAASHLTSTPGRGLGGLQKYYSRVAARRGWDGESARDTLLLLTEELGELARAVRKDAGLRRDGAYPTSNIHAELADVQLYLVHLANTLGIDLADAVTSKERVNSERFAAHAA